MPRANVLDESGIPIVPLQNFLRPKGGGDNVTASHLML